MTYKEVPIPEDMIEEVANGDNISLKQLLIMMTNYWKNSLMIRIQSLKRNT
jgi:hypothetical protein